MVFIKTRYIIFSVITILITLTNFYWIKDESTNNILNMVGKDIFVTQGFYWGYYILPISMITQIEKHNSKLFFHFGKLFFILVSTVLSLGGCLMFLVGLTKVATPIENESATLISLVGFTICYNSPNFIKRAWKMKKAVKNKK